MPYKKKGTDNWYITWTEGGRQRSRSSRTTDHAEARRLENKLRGTAHTRAPAVIAGSPTVDTILGEYLKAVPSERAAWAIKSLLAHWAGRPIDEITPEVYYQYIADRGVSQGTIAREMGTLRAALRHCRIKLGWEIPNVTEGRMPQEPRHRIRWLTRDEAQRLLDAVSNRVPYLRDFIELGLHTGLRKGELLGLTWDRVDIEGRAILFEPQHHKNSTYAAVPINDTAAAVFAQRKALADAHPNKPTHVLFRAVGGKPIGNIKKGFAAAAQRAGLTDLTPHDLRHTCASWLVQAGVELAVVKDILRHADFKTTLRYAHLAPKNLRDGVGKLDQVRQYGSTSGRFVEPSTDWAGVAGTAVTAVVGGEFGAKKDQQSPFGPFRLFVSD